jgi:hypothetical protein
MKELQKKCFLLTFKYISDYIHAHRHDFKGTRRECRVAEDGADAYVMSADGWQSIWETLCAGRKLTIAAP